MGRTRGVVVAGGAGLRLGAGVPKASAVLAGETLLDRAVATLAVVCDDIVVVTPSARRPGGMRDRSLARDASHGAAASREAPVWIEDAAGGAGPLAGVVAGLVAGVGAGIGTGSGAGLGAEFGAGLDAGRSLGEYERAVVLGVDFPFVTAALLRALLAELESSGAAAVVPAPGGLPQPLVAVYAPRAAAVLAAAFASGERSVICAVMALAPRELSDDSLATLGGGLDEFFNLNTPEDFAEAERRIAARTSVPESAHHPAQAGVHGSPR